MVELSDFSWFEWRKATNHINAIKAFGHSHSSIFDEQSRLKSRSKLILVQNTWLKGNICFVTMYKGFNLAMNRGFMNMQTDK